MATFFSPIRPWYLVKVEPKKRLNLFGRNFSMPCGGLDRIRLMSRWRKLDFFFIKSVKNAAVSTFQVLDIFVKHELHFFTGARHGE